MSVPVLDKNKKPLMPCSEKRARKLMEKNTAKPFWARGFEKTSAKLKDVWEAHIVDSHCLCEMLIGNIKPFKGFYRFNFFIDRNTAFIHIFNENRDCFVSDNLSSYAESYLNENTRWKDQYNSTMIVPIRYCPEGHHNNKIFGLIAVDSMNSKKRPLYENKECCDILGHAADLLANFFLLISITKEN